MKTIKNIHILKGLSANGWDIKEVSENTKLIGGNYYVFKFDNQYLSGQLYEIEVWLSRNATNQGNYEMFVMGWAGSTEMLLADGDWKKPNFILYYITECLRKIPNN